MAVVPRPRKDKKIVYWVAFKHEGKLVWERSGLEKREAHRLDKLRRQQVKDGTYVAAKKSEKTPVGEYFLARLDQRKNRTAADDAARVRDHVLSHEWFAVMPVGAVRPRHLIQLVDEIKKTPSAKTGKPLAGKTISNIFGIVHTLFRDAQIEELTNQNPCVIPKGSISRKTKKRAPYAADAVARLTTGGPVDLDAMVWNALAFFTGMREGEVCGRRFRNLDGAPKPLGSLLVDTQYNDQPLKTDDTEADHPRLVPVHERLRDMLQWWWAAGFELVFCRKPNRDDFIVPHRDGGAHTRSSAYKMWRRSCDQAGVTNISLHSTRHTFITNARRGGADKDILEKVTHNATGDIVDGYTHWDWAPLCEAVSCLRYPTPEFDSGFDRVAKLPSLQVEAPGIEDRAQNGGHGKPRELASPDPNDDPPITAGFARSGVDLAASQTTVCGAPVAWTRAATYRVSGSRIEALS